MHPFMCMYICVRVCVCVSVCGHVLGTQVASGAKRKLPFAIMTSDDTHARTVHLLHTHGYFGLDPSQVSEKE